METVVVLQANLQRNKGQSHGLFEKVIQSVYYTREEFILLFL